MNPIQRIFLTLTLLFAAWLAVPAHAYDDTLTHKQMTLTATRKSVLYTDPSIMTALGLDPVGEQFFIYRGRSGNVPGGRGFFWLDEFVAEGAIDEDAGDRAANHFFDPYRNIPLRYGVHLGTRSWEWTIEPEPIDGQEHSLSDAIDLLTRSLTAPEQQERGFAVTQMLLSLGHAMHHMQDMAQPQHVRNDQHYDGSTGEWYLRPFINPSLYEYYTRQRQDSVVNGANAAAPVFPGSTAFKNKHDFWENASSSGIAERVNRDYVSAGTNFTAPLIGSVGPNGIYPNPVPAGPADYTPAQLFAPAAVPAEVATLCANAAINCTMTMYSSAVQQRASTLSIFDQDIREKGVTVVYVPLLGNQYISRRLFALNRFNFDDAHPELIKRAVSYSAGIVNHFFRGKLDIAPPAQGPYAVVDHSTGEGFTKLKAEITNATPNEALANGTIRAIVKFYRNKCYRPDLSGEVQVTNGQLVTACSDWLSAAPEVRVSEEQSVSLGADEYKELSFTFSDPIPIDAIHTTLQVYYTGKVGDEEESFALGATDISEPAFITLMNASDQFELNGVFYYPQQIIDGIANPPFSAIDYEPNGIYKAPPDVPVEQRNMSFEIYVDGAKIGEVASVPPGRFVRFAALLDSQSIMNMDVLAKDGVFTLWRNSQFYPRVFHYHGSQVGWRITPVQKLRENFQYATTTWHRFFPYAAADVKTMKKSLDPEANTVVPLQMTASFAGMAPSAWATSINMFGAMRTNTFERMWPQIEPQDVAQPSMLNGPMKMTPSGPGDDISVQAVPARP
jgi:hypothetical protein